MKTGTHANVLAPPAFGRKAAMPERVRPMLAMVTDQPFSDPDWLFEVKWDGVRALCYLRDGKATLVSRNLNDITREYPEVAAGAERALAGHRSAIIDGEIVAFEESEGRGLQPPPVAGIRRPSFQRLQQRMHLTRPEQIRRMMAEVPVAYCVFDIVYLDGKLLTGCELVDRRCVLQQAVQTNDQVLVPDAVEERGEEFFEAAKSNQLEGIMAKCRTSRYAFGSRSRDWLKLKITKTLDCVIGGYTDPRGTRAFFGALLLGLYGRANTRFAPAGDGGRLVYIGHTGTGFDYAGLERMYRMMKPLETKQSPFDPPPRPNAPAHWLRPELVAEIKYAEITGDGRLRHPVFMGLRTDKSPRECAMQSELPDDVALHAAEETVEAEPPPRIRITKADKPLWPAFNGNPPITKQMLADYYDSLRDAILPFTGGRPLMLNRYPDGITGPAFFQKDYPDPVPRGVDVYVYHSIHAERDVRHVVCSNRITLKWLAQLACVELNCWMSRVDMPNRPDFVVFDIDPYITWKRGRKASLLSADDYDAAADVARKLKPVLDQVGLRGFLKTSGQTGLHVFVPIRREYVYDQVTAYAKAMAQFMERSYPKLITTAWKEEDRAGRVFFDYSINARGKTLVGPYSPRPTPPATVSAPITWDELDHARPTDFTMFNIKERLKDVGDLWAGIFGSAQQLG